MAIEDMLVNTINWQAQNQGTDATMGPVYEPYQDRFIDDPCRIDPATSDQKLEYGIDLQKTAFVVYTLQEGIQNGWRGYRPEDIGPDGILRALRVAGSKPYRAIGSLDTYYAVTCEQIAY